jgi:polar amino acid transport system substrate-binding protein
MPKAFFRTLAILQLMWLVTTPAHADLLAKIRADGKVRVAISAWTPPFNYLDAKGQLAGSEVDTAHLLAHDLGVKLEIVRIVSADRIRVLLDHSADLVLSTLAITPERERQIAFSVPYAQIPVVIAGPLPHQYASILDLEGKTVGALANSSNIADLEHAPANITLVRYQENSALMAGYAAGEFAILSAPQSLVDIYNHNKPKRPLITQFTQEVFDIAIGMPNGEKPLRDWINAWGVGNLRNGNLGDIYRKHHGGDLPSTIAPSGSGNK